MTLLVAAADNDSIWMIADTAITGGTMSTRDRADQLKIVMGCNNGALIGFAGDEYRGFRSAIEASRLADALVAIDLLLSVHLNYPSVDFAFGHIANGKPRLLLISNGKAAEVQTLHLGIHSAFEAFQRIRHDPDIEFVPNAVKTFMCGSRSSVNLPAPLPVAIVSMLRLFSETERRDVGGWVLPCFLNKEGAFLCNYAFGMSDPIMASLPVGAAIPHGTAEAGGYGFSLTEIGEGAGIAAYWLQMPGGKIYLRNENGFHVEKISGSPAEFKLRGEEVAGLPIGVWFGQKFEGLPQTIRILRDRDGRPSISVAQNKGNLSLSILTANSFKATTAFDLRALSAESPFMNASSGLFELSLSNDKTSVTIALKGDLAGEQQLNSDQVDYLIHELGQIRRQMSQPIASQPSIESGSVEFLEVDPAWRTDRPPSGELDGAVLRLRHPAFGWLAFFLPRHEARSLGNWLSEFAGLQSGGQTK